MAKTRTLRVLPVALASWRSAFAAFRSMKSLFVMIAALLAAVVFLEISIFSKSFLRGFDVWYYLLPSFLIMVSEIINAFILAPLAIAVHRFVLLGEVASNDKPLGDLRRYRRFVAYAAVLVFVTALPILQTGLEWSTSNGRDDLISAAFQIARIVLPIGVFAIFLNTMILFPAIAVDAAGASIRNAFSDSWLHIWPVLLVVACTIAPVYAVHYLLMGLLQPDFQSTQSVFFLALTKSMSYVVASALFGATASYIYACYARDLGRPPELSGKTVA